MPTATEEQCSVLVAPFGIEIDNPTCSDCLIQSIPGVVLRGAIDCSRSIKDNKTGDYMVPRDRSMFLASFPKVPGMQLHVKPEELSYAIIDPLYENEDLCEKIHKFLNVNTAIRTGGVIKGVPTHHGELDKNRIKTLCREMFWLLSSEDARRVKGPIPDIDDIDNLPGYYLLNPGSTIMNAQPVYEKDLAGWVDRLSQTGG